MTTVKYERATWRPRRENCSPPAIEQFPRPLMGPDARKHGGLIIHILAAIYTFLGLAIVCDDYFVSSLDRICEGKEKKNFRREKFIRSKFNCYSLLLTKMLNFVTRRATIVSRCCWSNFHGCGFLSPGIGNCGNRRFLCQR